MSAQNETNNQDAHFHLRDGGWRVFARERSDVIILCVYDENAHIYLTGSKGVLTRLLAEASASLASPLGPDE